MERSLEMAHKATLPTTEAERRQWALAAKPGEYLASDDAYGADEIDQIDGWLNGRGLHLAPTDRGLRVERIAESR